MTYYIIALGIYHIWYEYAYLDSNKDRPVTGKRNGNHHLGSLVTSSHHLRLRVI